MTTYLIIIGISTLLAYLPIVIEQKTKNKKLALIAKIVVILFPAIIAGIRYNVGTDYAGAYKPYFNEMLTGNHTYRMRKIEIGYELLNKIVIFFGGNFNVLMFLCSLVTISSIYIGLEHYKDKINVPLAYFFFMIIFYQKTFNLVRQMMSIAIIFYAFKFLDIKDRNNLEKKEYLKYVAIEYGKYFTLVIVAALFQRMSLVMLLIPFIREIYTNPKYKYFKWASYIILLLLMFNFKTIGEIMAKFPKLEYYSYYFLQNGEHKISVAYFIRILPAILPYFLIRKELEKDKQLNLLFSMNILGSILLLLGYLTSTYGERLALFFTIFQIVLFPYYIRYFKKNKIQFWLAIALFVSVNMAIWYYDYIYKGRDETVPYKTIFSIEAKEEKNSEDNKNEIKVPEEQYNQGTEGEIQQEEPIESIEQNPQPQVDEAQEPVVISGEDGI